MTAESRRSRHLGVRRGATLLHVMVYVFCLSMVLSTLAVLMRHVAVLRSDAVSTHARGLALQRLAGDLRRDAHWAVAVTADAEKSTLALTVKTADAEQQVVYTAQRQRLLREARKGEQVVAREEYALEDLTAAVPLTDSAPGAAGWDLQFGARRLRLPLDVGRYVRRELQP